MANNFFKNNDVCSHGSNAWMNTQEDLAGSMALQKTSKLWLIMIGGSAAGIISPLSRYFLPKIENNIIVPIFIDKNSNSDSIATSIADLANYEVFCRLTCTKARVSQPFLFIEESVDSLLVIETFQKILDSISPTDKVVIVFSAHSNYAISIATRISQLCSSAIEQGNIKYGVFLPYFTYGSNEDAIYVLRDNSSMNLLNTINHNLEILTKDTDACSTKFLVGLSEKSIITESSYQRNPFNIVQLIMAFAVASSNDNHGGYQYYSIPNLGQFVAPLELIKEESFRNLLIAYDFKQIAFQFLINHKEIPSKLLDDRNLIDAICSYLDYGTDIILSLSDKTVHRNNSMILRKEVSLNPTQLNQIFSTKTIFGRKTYNVTTLARELKKYIDEGFTVNANMAANETLYSIEKFFKEHYGEIAQCYY